MAIKQEPNTILNSINDPIASQTEIALATANGGIYAYQTTKDVYVTAVSQSINNQTVKNYVNDVAGSTTGEIQFFKNGTFSADKDFRYDSVSDSLILSGNLYAGKVNLQDTSNLAVGGGSPGDVLSTDGSGALTWISQTVLSSVIAANVSFVSTANVVSTDVQSAISELGNEKLALAGGIMTGPLYLAADPTAAQGAATKNYVDSKFLAGAVSSNYSSYAGNVTGSNQPNITSLGTLVSLNVTGNVTGGNLVTTGTVNATGNVSGGNIVTSGSVVGSTIVSSGTVTATGNVSGGNITTSGQVAAAGNVSGGNITTSGQVNAVGTVSAGNLSTAGNLTVSASATVTGNVSGGNINTAGIVVATGNVSGGNITTPGKVVAAGDITTTGSVNSDNIRTASGPLAITVTGMNNIVLTTGTGNVTLSPSTYITNVKDPVNAQDASTKAYVDAFVQGLKPKTSVKAISKTNISLVGTGTSTIDGVTLTSGDRVLVSGQTIQAQNGIYVSNGTDLIRASDADTATDLPAGTFVFVESGGTQYGSTGHVLTKAITTLGTDPVVFTQFASAASYTAGSGLTLAGTQFSISATSVTAGSYGNATHVPSLTVSSTGQLTAASTTPVVANAETLAGTFLKSTVTGSSLTSLGTLGTLLVSGNANVGNIGATAGVFTSITGNLVGNVSGNGAGLTNITGANVTGAVAFATTANAVAGANVSGAVAFATTANAVAGANVSGAVPFATTANAVAGANVSGAVPFATTANSVAGANVSGAVAFATTANAVAGANVSGAVALATSATSANSVAGANVSGAVALATNANFANFAGNVTVAAQPNITSVGTLTGITSTGTANFVGASNVSLGPVGNVKITGGTTGQVLSTDGSGLLSWITTGGSTLSNGTSNVSVAASGNVSIGSAGTPNELVVTSTGVNVAGTFNAVGNANVGNIGATGGVFTYITGDGGNLSNITGANVTGAVLYATTANSVAGANVSGAVAFATTANSVAGGNVLGTVASATIAATANTVAGANVTGAVAFATTANAVAGANVSGTVASATVAASANSVAGANVTGTVASATVAASANAVAGANVSGEVAFAAVANSVAGANVTGAVALATSATSANSVAGANVSGQVANALVAGTVYTAAQPNITSVGTLTSLAVTGTATVGNVSTAGNVTATGNVQADTAFVGNALTTRTGPLTLTASGTSNITLGTGTGNINLSTSTFITNVKDPVSAQDAATKAYVDSLVQGLKPKASVNCATVSNVNLASPPATIDGHTLATGDRVLVKAQTAQSENGIYTYDGAALVRATDADTAADVVDGTFVFVESGSTFGASGFVQTGVVTTLGTDPIVFTQFSTGGSYTAGSGLTLTGSQFSVSATGVTAGSYGNATHIGTFTVDAKGQLTAAGTAAVTANAETLAGTTLKSTVVNSSLTSVGTLTTLAVTGAATAASFTGAHAGEAGNLSNIQGSNVVGNVTSAVTANFANFAGNVTVAAQPNITSVGTLTSLAVTGAITGGSTITAAGNVIAGAITYVSTTGTAGQVLATHANGVTYWTSISSSKISNGTSNVDIATSGGNVTVGVGGTAGVAVLSTGGANITGFANISGVANVGSLNVVGTSNLGAVGNVTITGGTTGQVLKTNGSGVLSWGAVTIDAANVTFVATGNIANTNVQTALVELDSEKIAKAASSTDNALVRWDLTGGNLVQDSIVTLDDGGNVAGVATLTGQNVKVDKVYSTLTSSAATATGVVDCSLSNYFIKSLAGATTISFTNVPATGTCYSCTIQITLGAAGAVTFPAAVRWQYSSTPTFAVSKTHLVMMVTTNGGTSWYATAVTDFA